MNKRGAIGEEPVKLIMFAGLAIVCGIALLFWVLGGIGDQGRKINDALTCEGFISQGLANAAGSKEKASGECASIRDCSDREYKQGYNWFYIGKDKACEEEDENRPYCCLLIPDKSHYSNSET